MAKDEYMEYMESYVPKRLAPGADIRKLSNFNDKLAKKFPGSRDLLSEWAGHFDNFPMEFGKSDKKPRAHFLNIILKDGEKNIPVVKLRQEIKAPNLVQEIATIKRTVIKSKFGGTSYRPDSTITYTFCGSLSHLMDVDVLTHSIPGIDYIKASMTLCASDTGKIDTDPATRPILEYIYGNPAAQIKKPFNNIVRWLIEKHPNAIEQMHLSASFDEYTPEPEYQFHIGSCPDNGKKFSLQGTKRIFKWRLAMRDGPIKDAPALFGDSGKMEIFRSLLTQEYNFEFPKIYEKMAAEKSWGDALRIGALDYIDNYLLVELADRKQKKK